MLLMMSYSLLCRSTNDAPRHPHLLWTAPTPGSHISNLFWVGVALGEASLVFMKPYYRCTRMTLGAQTRATTPFRHLPSHAWFLPHVPQTISHHPLSFLFLFTLSSKNLCSFLLFFSVHTPPSSTSLEAPVSAPLRLPSFNTCQDSWGTSYTARISFERTPQDVIIRIITGPYGWCYINVPSHTELS